MNKQTVYIINFLSLYKILEELQSFLNFDLKTLDINNLPDELKKKEFDSENYLFLSNNQTKAQVEKLISKEKILIIENLPIPILNLVERINISLLKMKFKFQSRISIKNYEIDLNTKNILKDKKSMKLTEKEIQIILFLFAKKKPQKIETLQTEIWNYRTDLETHTVETHIYRLRKKMNEIFKEKSFILSNNLGYFI
mgnify:CR=1 FL=1|tara:strand:- start:240 stop:830 length:591 start_codon:yes stop_codon:yes gene_type:complete